VKTLEKIESAIKHLEFIHQKAEELALKWFPDIEKYPQQKRIAVLSVMKMLMEIIQRGE